MNSDICKPLLSEDSRYDPQSPNPHPRELQKPLPALPRPLIRIWRPRWIMMASLLSFGLMMLCITISLVSTLPTKSEFDLVILGATPAGIMAAVAAARMGTPNIVIVERTSHIGGLPANGLGATDIATRGATGGLFLEFVERVEQYYIKNYGAGSQQHKDCSGGYRFEPRVAEIVLEGFLQEVEMNVKVARRRQFDAHTKFVTMRSGDTDKIAALQVLNLDSKIAEIYYGKFFIDATYEGDLIGAAGVSFSVGREPASKYNEVGAGKIYKYWNGPETEDSTHEGDDAIQAFNYRVTLTSNRTSESNANRIAFARPANYDRSEYVGLIQDIMSGCHTGYEARELCPGGAPESPIPITSPNPRYVPGAPAGLQRLSSTNVIPNGKWDANNQHLAFISTDLPEENFQYPTASWEWRDKFAKRLREYTEGLFYFAANDRDVPEWFRAKIQEFGWPKDEYTDNGGFPRQVYVREGRRMIGEYIFTANDAIAPEGKWRPPVHGDSITSSHYALDSHATHKREEGKPALEGFLSYETRPYTVPFRIMVPKQGPGAVKNLLAPVPASSSHIGFSTLRMEPCWMALGQAAGVAFGVLREIGKDSVTDVDVRRVQEVLFEEGAVLVYSKYWSGMTREESVREQWRILKEESVDARA